MKRWIVAAALVLPLPFAALPLMAVVLGGRAAGPDEALAFEVTPVEQPAVSPADTGHTSLGFRLNFDEPVDCHVGGDS